jgi:hypothetical protein
MRKIIFPSLGALLFLTAGITCQANTLKKPTRAVLNVRVNDSGSELITHSGMRLHVADPKILDGHDGQQIVAQCRVSENTVQVLKVIKGIPAFWADWYNLHFDDSSFRK